jgi:hypothetical protein
MLLPTDSLIVTVGGGWELPWPAVAAVANTTAVVGSPLLLTVRTHSAQPFEDVVIDVKDEQARPPTPHPPPLPPLRVLR